MADHFLHDHPEVKPYVLSGVQLTGTTIGHGAYSSVEEVAVCGAAKTVHDVLLSSPKITSQFVEELQLMSTLRHPNIVQFLGVCFFPDSRLPALVMERLLTSLHDLLDPETDEDAAPDAPSPLSFFKIDLKCSVLQNVACGLAYLHERSPPIIHRDLSAKNVLLTSELVAKIADLGVARIVPRMRAAATMTKVPGTFVYMPPEAIAPADSSGRTSKYDGASIDVFSLGVVAIYTIGETFPCDPLAPTYMSEQTGLLKARTELQRRSEYMRCVKTKLRVCGQLREDHPLVQLIQQCLHNIPAKRPSISEALHFIEAARNGIRNEASEINREKLVQALQNRPRSQTFGQVHQHLMRDITDQRQELQFITKQLTMKKAELTRAEETVKRVQRLIQETENTIKGDQQQTKEMEQQEAMSVQAMKMKITQEQSSKREIEDLERQLRSSEDLVADFQKQLQKRDSELDSLRAMIQRTESPQIKKLSTSPAFRPKNRKHEDVPGLCGLYNLGNTCFMNSALQCLSNTKPLRDYFVQEEYAEDIQEDNPLGSEGQIAKSFGTLMKQMWSGQHHAISPSDLKMNVGSIAPRFYGRQQQDAHELLVFLVDGLHEDLNSGNRKRYKSNATGLTVTNNDEHFLAEEAWKKHQWRNISRMVDLFYGQLQISLMCCNKRELTFDPFSFLTLQLPIESIEDLPSVRYKRLKEKPQDQSMSLHDVNKPLSCDDKSSDIPTPANKEISTQVDISHKRRRGREKRTTSKSASKVSVSHSQEEKEVSFTLKECFDFFTDVKELAESDQWKCTAADCNSRCRIRTCNFSRVPQVLIISLKRFSPQWIKLRNFVNFPLRELDLMRYMAHHSVVRDDSSMQKYDLYAVCNHSGSLQLGHYYAYCKRTESDGSEKWYNFDDSRITEIDESEVVTEDAYILFYIRQSK